MRGIDLALLVITKYRAVRYSYYGEEAHMNVLILGGDGYLGWPTAMYLSRHGHKVAVVDNFIKRQWEAEKGVEPLIPVATLHERVKVWKQVSGQEIDLYVGNITNHRFLYSVLASCKPDAIIHYAEQPSAPFSMIDRHHAVVTQSNNVLGTLNLMFAMQHSCPDAHMIKLGTMGEYGTPNIDIEEGFLDVEHNGRKDRVLFPKKPFSFYHLSKVHDSANLYFGCDVWGMRVTDLNQGVVYGIDTDETKIHERLATAFHYDEVFGTALNRFCTQAIAGIPLTVYGAGKHKRSFLNITDTLKCVEIALNSPAAKGEFRVFNQFTEVFSMNELATAVQRAAGIMKLDVKIKNIENPRIEKAEHYYNPSNNNLLSLGLNPVKLSDALIDDLMVRIKQHKNRINHDVIYPTVKWKHDKKIKTSSAADLLGEDCASE